MDHGYRGGSSLLMGSLLLILVACDGSSPTQPGGPLSVVTVHAGTSVGFPAAGEGAGTVIGDGGTWQATWQRLGRTGAAPAVDFSRDMVLLLAGPGCSGETEIRSVSQLNGRVVVEALTTACSNTICIVADYSVHAVKVQRVSQAVDFVVTHGDKICGR
jgi:hypothetical protein